MKTIKQILLVLVLLPCLMVGNESETILPNLLGFGYIGLLFILRNTSASKWLVDGVKGFEDKEIEG